MPRDHVIKIQKIYRIRQRYNINHTRSLIKHRHCNDIVQLSDGQHSKVYYVIAQRQGLASLTWNVSFCIVGAALWKVYGAHCRSLR